MLKENIGPQGSLDTDKMARALQAYRNTPSKDLGLSPAQILYGRVLRDHLPTPKEFLEQRKEWVLLKEEREKTLTTKYGRVQEDLGRHAHTLKPLEVGSVVQVQNQRGKDPLRWDKSGVIVETLGNQQYTVRMDGSGRVTLRNRRFLRQIQQLVPRYKSLDNVIPKHHNENIKDVPTKELEIESPVVEEEAQVAQRDGDVEEPRRSSRNSKPPERYDSRL